MQARPVGAWEQLPITAHEFTGSLRETLLEFGAVGFRSRGLGVGDNPLA